MQVEYAEKRMLVIEWTVLGNIACEGKRGYIGFLDLMNTE